MATPILVPFDGSLLAERAFPFAARLAGMIDGRVIVVRALDRHEPHHQGELALYPIAEKLSADGIPAEVLIVHGEPAPAIVHASREVPEPVIVMSTHGRSGLGRWLYGSVADEVLRTAGCPVLLIPAACDHLWSSSAPFRALVPLDGSDVAEEALDIVYRWIHPKRSEIVLVRSVHPGERSLAHATEEGEIAREKAETELRYARQYLSEVGEALRQNDYVVHERVVAEPPARAISHVARESGIDLVVMTTHGRGGVPRLVLGSVATGVLHRAHVPLLLTRPLSVRAMVDSPSLTHAL